MNKSVVAEGSAVAMIEVYPHRSAIAAYPAAYAFTSVWCAYAAVVSVLIYFHFRR